MKTTKRRKEKLPPEALPFRRERILSAGLLTLFAPLPLVFADSLAPLLFAAWALLLGLHLLFVSKGKILVLPDWSLNLLGLAAMVAVFRYRFGFRSLLRAAIVLLLVTTLAKLAAIRRESDFAFVLSLSAFLFVGSLATSFHVSILFYLVPYAALAWAVLVRWSVWRDLAGAEGEWRRPAAREIPRPRQVGAAVAAVLLTAIPFFLLLPRIRSPYVRGIQADSREVWTGFSESVDPTVSGVIHRSERVQLRIEGEPAALADPGALRLRTLAFTTWDGKSWTRPKGGGRMLPPREGGWARLGPREAAPLPEGHRLLIDLLPLRSRFLPVPGDAAALRFAGSAQRRSGAWLERDRLSNVLVPFTPDRNLQYEVLVGGQEAFDLREPGPDDPSRAAPGSEAVRRFVVERAGLPGPGRTPEAVARALEKELSSRFAYSLETPLRGGKPVEDFLFRQRSGHCEAFATAMAAGLREVGIPSRLVTGFLGAEAGLFGNTWVVRGKNAHAWVEAWVGPERGWVAFDPTPADGRPTLEKASWLRSLRNAGEDVEFFYDRWVLSFGESDQGELVRVLRDAAGAVESGLLRAFRSVASGRRLAAALGAALLLAGALAWLAAALARRWRDGGRAGLEAGRAGPGAGAYRTARRLLRKKGLALSPATSPAETVAAAATIGLHAGAVAAELVTLYVAESFGGRPPTADERRGLARLMKELKDELAKANPPAK